MAGTYNFAADQGATLLQKMTWKDPNQVPIDLTGYTGRMHVRTAVNATTPTLVLTTENGRILLGDYDAATPTLDTGEITLLVEAEAMEDVAPGTYFYDLEMVSAGGIVTRLVQGKIKVKAEVTR